MIYTTGTVNTVSGSAIVRGTGTKFKNNNPAINIGMTILIKSGTTNIPYMIKSVNSDTELVLAQPALATATNTTFSIHITEPDNNSDAARTMVAINSYVEYFLDAMNTWMTQTGQTKIEMPNGEIVTLDSINKMQGDISGKLDKIGGVITGNLTTSANLSLANAGADKAVLKRNKDQAAWLAFLSDSGVIRWRAGMSTEGDNDKFKIAGWSSGGGTYVNALDISYGGSIVLTESSCLINGKPAMRSGDFGWGGSETPSTNISEAELRAVLMNRNTVTQIIRNEQTTKYGLGGSPIAYFKSKDTYQALVSSWNGGSCRVVAGNATSEYVHNLWTDRNTTVDSNGFIKRASPIIDINSDGSFTTNDESEGATVTRVAKGEYLIEGVLGFNSDAGWGGVDGGIEIPLDVNKQPLIWVNSKVNKDGSILVKTYHRTHPNAPEFANNKIDGFNDGDPIDIPDGRFISVRVQMPEGSIYNVRMHEMEEAQKAEEERRQKEEEENQDTNKTPEIDN
ncbi:MULTISPECIES: phage tail fiber protein [unclassified Shigella]|uniref:phage tail fiber protein n=1 Tax=unclassified Shigella TaxID=2629414 RepID=UPI0008480D71|nr:MULTISPECIES: hypothetical protein [unclassified Shigella]ODQ08156.1 hypothetical protein BGK50_12610 [Shigella sp. FC130]OEI93251.1 hypothetical protein BHE86_05490 [Shigella sp. FC1655]OEJ07680.1 hypothetical protein BHE89_15965 [Shigella sp. FC1967]